MELFTFPASQLKTKSSVWIEVNLSHLEFNFKALAGRLFPGVSVMAVVKANAYGHGMIPVARALAGSAAWFGVASLAEGMALRKEGLSHPILVFGHLAPDEVSEALEWDLTLSVSDSEYGAWIGEAAVRGGHRAKIHVKADTGMGRFGFDLKEARERILKLAATPGLNVEGIYTHFPQAEKPRDPFTLSQISSFGEIVAFLRKDGLQFRWVHASGSSAVAQYPEAQFNLVRPGIMMYGLYPDPALKAAIELRPVLTLQARLVMIKDLAAGQSAGYGRTFVTPRDTRIGVLPVGYSHGYFWNLHDQAQALYRGRLLPVAGRISMDTLAVDLGPASEARVGDTVTLIGGETQPRIEVEDLARKAGTISYEIVTRLHPHIERIYHRREI
jgi:alanine racemase